jgi:hypothetical protein
MNTRRYTIMPRAVYLSGGIDGLPVSVYATWREKAKAKLEALASR